jgi:hypothetical protein
MNVATLLPRGRGALNLSRRTWYLTLYAFGAATMGTATGYLGIPGSPIRVPHPITVVLGLLMVFVVPGWSLVCTALPQLESWLERLLASVGISIIVATCGAVLLAATPIGFSRQPFAELLGGFVVTFSLGGIYRVELAAAVERLRVRAAAQYHVWAKKFAVAAGHNAPRPHSSAKPARVTESDARRSVLTLRFSFDHDHADSGV